MLKLTLNLNGTTENLELEGDLITIGRSVECTVTIKNKKVSRQHAKIERVGNAFQITDLESGNGTRVNGKKIDFHAISKDDVIKIGDAVLTVEEIDHAPEGISLDDDDEQDLLPDVKDISEVKTEPGLEPVDPGVHGQDTEVELDLPDEPEIKVEPAEEPDIKVEPAEKPEKAPAKNPLKRPFKRPLKKPGDKK